jgi:hypothetical protein
MPANALQLQMDPSILAPLIHSVVVEVLAQVEADREWLHAKIAYTEAEAARLLSLNPHQLRDERLRGRIVASIGPGRRVLYSRDDLMTYLASRRWTAAAIGRSATG